MVEGKTAALIAVCTQIGALLGGANLPHLSIELYRILGRDLGFTFKSRTTSSAFGAMKPLQVNQLPVTYWKERIHCLSFTV